MLNNIKSVIFLGLILVVFGICGGLDGQVVRAGEAQKADAVAFQERVIDVDLNSNVVHAVDLDRDNDTDLVVLESNMSEDDRLLWFENNGNQTFSERVITANFDSAESVFAADLNGDMEVDLVTAETASEEFSWWQNDGSENFSQKVITDSIIGTNVVFAVDLDEDTDIDIVSGSAEGFHWWENDGVGNFTGREIDGNFDAVSIGVGDLDGDNDLDIAAVTWWDSQIAWYENDGSENFSKHELDAITSTGYRMVVVTDLDGETGLDILTSEEDEDEVLWWENNGTGTFTKRVIDTEFSNANAVQAADVDGDGDMDVIAVGSWPQDELSWFENNGSEVFTENVIDSSTAADSLLALDLDRDTDIDLVTADSVLGLSWWEQLGSPNGVGKQAHYRIGGDTLLDSMSWYELRDTPATGMVQGENFRARFQIYNDGALDFAWRPQLEWSTSMGSGFSVVPLSSGVAPFFVTDTSQYANGALIATDNFGLGAGTGIAQAGAAYDSANPATAHFVLEAGHYTEISFNLQANANAQTSTSYYFRLSNAGESLQGYIAVAQVEMAATPGTVSGEVRDQKNSPLSGVSVRLGGMEKAITNFDGEFSFSASPGDHQLGFSKSGYWETEGSVAVPSGGDVDANQVMVAKSGCMAEGTNCALQLIGMLPFVGTLADLADVTSLAADLCEVGSLYSQGQYAKCAAKVLMWLADLANIPVLSTLLDLQEGIAAAECATERLDAFGQELGRLALAFWEAVVDDPGEETIFIIELTGTTPTQTQGFSASSGVDYELSSIGGDALRMRADVLRERSIPGSYGLASENGYAIGVVSQGTADYTLNFTTTVSGDYTLDLIVPQSDGTSLLVSFGSLLMDPGSHGMASLVTDGSDYTMDLDQDGDGVYETERQPSAVEISAIRVYLPMVDADFKSGMAWGYDRRLDNAPDGHQLFPDMVSGPDGTLYAVWEDYRDGEYRLTSDIYLAYSTDKGKFWSADLRVNNSGDAARRNPHLAAAPNGDVYVVWQDYRRDPNPTDPGLTREDAQNPDIYLAKLPHGGSAFGYDVLVYDQKDWQDAPDVAVDSQGRVYVTWYDRTDDIYYGNSVVARSTDGGASFGPPVIAEEHYAWALTPRLEIDRSTDRLHLVYQGHPRYYKPYYTQSSDGGSTWSADLRLDAGPDREWYDAARGIVVAVDEMDHVLVIWHDEREDADNCYTGGASCHDEFDIYANYSHDGGSSWLTESNVRINDDSGYDYIVNLSAAFAPDGRLAAVWRDNRAGEAEGDIYTATSADHGVSWSANQRVDHAPVASNADYPIVVIGLDGEVFVLWQDYRDGDWDIYVTSMGRE